MPGATNRNRKSPKRSENQSGTVTRSYNRPLRSKGCPNLQDVRKMRAVIGVVQVSTGGSCKNPSIGPDSRIAFGVSAGLSTNHLRLYSDPQAPWCRSPTVSSPETHESGIDSFPVKNDLTGQDQSSSLSSSPLVRPFPTNIPTALIIAYEGEDALAYVRRILAEGGPARTRESEWRRLLPFFECLYTYFLRVRFPPPLMPQRLKRWRLRKEHKATKNGEVRCANGGLNLRCQSVSCVLPHPLLFMFALCLTLYAIRCCHLSIFAPMSYRSEQPTALMSLIFAIRFLTPDPDPDVFVTRDYAIALFSIIFQMPFSFGLFGLLGFYRCFEFFLIRLLTVSRRGLYNNISDS